MTVKIGIVSDLHTEFWNSTGFNIHATKLRDVLSEADIILLAGDIGNSVNSTIMAGRIFPDKPVYLVPGNHEYYHSTFQEVVPTMRKNAPDNVHVIHRAKQEIFLNGMNIRILGATLWTDFNWLGNQPLSMMDCQKGMSDFNVIYHKDESGGLNRIRPYQIVEEHELDKAFLLEEIEKPFDGKTIVMTHHCPVAIGAHPLYGHDRLTPGFVSRLDHLFVRDEVDFLIWGHTHHNVSSMSGKTLLLSCQTGYQTTDGNETGSYGTVVNL